MAVKKYKWRIAGYIFKAICSLFIIAVVGLLLWRIIDSKTDPKEIKTLTPNSALCTAYRENNGKLNIFTQEQNTYSQGSETYGYFAVTSFCFIDEASQVQLSFRYNNSTIKYLAEDYSLPEIPDRASDLFDVSLLVAYDLTPDDDSDNESLDNIRFERISPTEQLPHQKTLYNYRKLIFDGLKIEKDVLAVYVDVYYMGDIDYEDTPYATLLLYHYTEPKIAYKLTQADIRAIEEWKE